MAATGSSTTASSEAPENLTGAALPAAVASQTLDPNSAVPLRAAHAQTNDSTALAQDQSQSQKK